MKKVFTIVLGLTAVMAANAQRTAGTASMGMANPLHVSMDKAPFDTLTPPVRTGCSDSLFMYTTEEGFVFGTNEYDDKRKGQIFENTQAGNVVGVFGLVYTAGSGSYTADVYSVSAGLPATLLGSSSATLAATVSNNVIGFVFPTAVAVPAANFAVAVNVDGAAGDTLAFFSTKEGCGNSQSVEQWDDNSWITVKDSWDDDFDLLIGVIVDRAGTGTAGIENLNLPSAAIAPNPAGDYTLMGYHTKENGNVVIKITNLSGQTVMVLNEGNRTAGTYTRMISVDELAAGTYLYQVSCNGKSTNGRIVVSK